MASTSNRIRVLVVGQTPPPQHGQAIMIQMLVDGPLKGIDVHHLRMAFSDNMDQVGRFQFRKVAHLFYLIAAMYWIRIRHNPQILYFPPSGPNRIPLVRDTLLLLSTRWLFRRTVFHFQASGVSELIARLPKWQQYFVLRALGRPDAAIQLSMHSVPDAEFLEARSVYYVPNAADDHASAFVRMHDPRSNEKMTRLLYLGTVCETKGILVLLDALDILRKENNDIHLDIVGSFQPAIFEATVIERLKELGLTSFVTIHGQKVGDEKWTLFAQADLFCFPTYYQSEGFPCVLVEAMSFSLPIVSTYWRGIPTIVQNGETGFLVQTKDSDGLANRIALLVSDRHLCKQMGMAARKKFEEEFTREKYLESVARVIADVSK